MSEAIKISFMVTAIILLVFVHQGFATEQSGRLLNELVRDVSSNLEGLEKKREQFEKEKGELNQRLESQFSQLKKERDILKAEIVKANLLDTISTLNLEDIGEVETILTTISTILPKLENIKKELSGMNETDGKTLQINTYRKQMGSFLSNAANILNNLKTKPNVSEKSKIRISSLEGNLVSMARSLALSREASLNYGEIDRVKITLEKSFADMMIIRNDLLNERDFLKGKNYSAIANLVVLQLGKGESIHNAPVYFQNSIKNRITIVKEMDKKGITANKENRNDGGLLADDELILQQIRDDELGWN